MENEKKRPATVLFLIRVGEIALKTGLPRIDFEKRLFSNINNFLDNRSVGGRVAKDGTGRVVVEVPEEKADLARQVLSRVFGISSFSRAVQFRYLDMGDLCRQAVSLLEREFDFGSAKSFGVRARVPGKSSRNFDSMSLGKSLGSAILEKFPGLKVDLDSPEIEVSIEAREAGQLCYLLTERFEGAGGLPYGSEGTVLVLLDGSEESALAAILSAKRGCSLEFACLPETANACAASIGRISGFLPQRKAKISEVSREGLPALVSEKKASGIVLGRSSPGDAREFPGIFELSPLELLPDDAINSLKGKYFSGGRDEVFVSEKKPGVFEAKW